MRALSNVWESIQQSMAGAERVADLLEQEPDVAERRGAIELPGRAKGAIHFEGVSFQYSEREMVLEGIDLDIAPGSVVALVGPTGVGKTTLAMLIPRFYDPCQGRITLDGHALRDLTPASLRRQVSLVLQEVFLFHGTVWENILFGRPDATEEEVINAARIANAHEFIAELPQGYDTMIGERGVKLSGGQRQRLAIARAVLKDAPILILDEATSAGTRRRSSSSRKRWSGSWWERRRSLSPTGCPRCAAPTRSSSSATGGSWSGGPTLPSLPAMASTAA